MVIHVNFWSTTVHWDRIERVFVHHPVTQSPVDSKKSTKTNVVDKSRSNSDWGETELIIQLIKSHQGHL